MENEREKQKQNQISQFWYGFERMQKTYHSWILMFAKKPRCFCFDQRIISTVINNDIIIIRINRGHWIAHR